MLICKMTNPPAGHTGEILLIEKDALGRVNVKIKATDFDFTFDPALVPNKPDVMFLNRNTLGQPAFTWLSQTGNAPDGYWSSRVAKRIHTDSICLILLAVDAAGEVFAYSLRAVENPKGFDQIMEVGFYNPTNGAKHQANDVLLSNATSSGTLAHYASPSLRQFIHRAHHKQTTMAKLNVVGNLDALECQVDLLTQLVVKLAEKAGVSADGLATLIEHSAIKGRDDALGKVAASKARMRKIQADHQAAVKEIEA